MDERNRGAADDATGGRRHDAHHQNQNREEPAELVLAQRHERNESGARVHEHGREERPQHDVVPHLVELLQRLAVPQAHHIGQCVQLGGRLIGDHRTDAPAHGRRHTN